MTQPRPDARYRFGIFEADTATGELRRQGLRIKLNAQPFQVLLMLLDHPGELVTREEIACELWPEGTYVDFERGVNSAINRIREALADSSQSPRFIETLARRGYRFVAPVECTPASGQPSRGEHATDAPAPAEPTDAAPGSAKRSRFLATAQELPKIPRPVVQRLFILLQLMYAGFYVGALANLAEIEDLFSALPKFTYATTVLIVSAAILIPVRAFLITAALFHAPGLREKYLRIWPAILVLDVLWALSPFLLLHHISFGVALACTALLVYAPFAQRSLILMGAGTLAPVHTTQ
jgi:cholera toxin transcriptional activator